MGSISKVGRGTGHEPLMSCLCGVHALGVGVHILGLSLPTDTHDKTRPMALLVGGCCGV